MIKIFFFFELIIGIPNLGIYFYVVLVFFKHAIYHNNVFLSKLHSLIFAESFKVVHRNSDYRQRVSCIYKKNQKLRFHYYSSQHKAMSNWFLYTFFTIKVFFKSYLCWCLLRKWKRNVIFLRIRIYISLLFWNIS